MFRVGRYCFSLVRGYRGHDRKGINRFANGFGYRSGSWVWRAWRLGDNDYCNRA